MKRFFPSDPRLQGLAFFALGIGCFILAGLMVFFFSGKFQSGSSGMVAGPAISAPSPQGAKKEEPLPAPPEEKKEWVLYITGSVASPGVYSLPPDSRVHQLVEAAGGLSPGADPVGVNLAAPLADGVHIHVPAARKDGEQRDVPPASSPSGEGFVRPRGAPELRGAVMVNSASMEELQRIPGVGPATARAIIERRTQGGRFNSLQDLLSVKGIGPKKLNALKDYVDLR